LTVPAELTEEHILVIPEAVIEGIGAIEGFEADVDRYLKPILKSDQLSFQPRSQMETDPSFKQLIPYVLLQWNDPAGSTKLYTYTRGGGGGESRLHAKRSVGIGGHISLEDATDGSDPYFTGMQRELSEEVMIGTPYRDQLVGILNDDETPVGKVHLGIVHIFDVDSQDVAPREDEIIDAGFEPVERLLADLDDFETWSAICLEALFGQQ
jgi:predicted NUDIX family phosphoesterase